VKTVEFAGGYLTTDIRLACKTDRAAMWEPKDPQGDARNADPRMISQKGETADEAEAKVLAILKRRALDK
jgi:hypothetical protein